VRSCYDEGKRAAETLCFDYHRQVMICLFIYLINYSFIYSFDYHRQNGVDIRVARIFNTYGRAASRWHQMAALANLSAGRTRLCAASPVRSQPCVRGAEGSGRGRAVGLTLAARLA